MPWGVMYSTGNITYNIITTLHDESCLLDILVLIPICTPETNIIRYVNYTVIKIFNEKIFTKQEVK